MVCVCVCVCERRSLLANEQPAICCWQLQTRKAALFHKPLNVFVIRAGELFSRASVLQRQVSVLWSKLSSSAVVSLCYDCK